MLRIQRSSTMFPVLLALCSLILILILFPAAAHAALDEAYGMVRNVVDGDTFDLIVEKTDPRIASGAVRVRLADVNSPEIETPAGSAARDFAYAVLMNRRVLLDIDDQSGSGRDSYGRLVCVVYLSGAYGQPIASPCFNRMLVDSGHAVLENFTNNEFNPADWWSGQGSGLIFSPLAGVEGLVQDLPRRIQQEAGSGLEGAANEASGWLRSWLKNQL